MEKTDSYMIVCLIYFENYFDLPDIWRVVDLITLLVSEDEGRHRHVGNGLCDLVHLAHDCIHLVEVITWIKWIL